MFTKEQVALRSNWEARIQKSGFNPEKWSEGQMIVLGKLPTSISQAISESLPKVVNKINAFFENADPELCPEYPGITRNEVYKAVAQSWAHQDFSLTVRMDFAVTKGGNLHLLAIKGDNLDSTVGVARSAKAWYDHYYEGDVTHVSINHLAEHVASILKPYGKQATPPSFKDISVLSTRESSATYLADAVTKSSDLSLSKVGVAGLEALGDIEHEENIGSAVIKVDPWAKVLENAEEGSPWIEAFKTPRTFIMQPPWVLLLDEVLDFKEPVDEADIEFVLNIWMSDPGSSNTSPLVVASEYFPGYSFEEAMVMPFIMNTTDFKAQSEALQKAHEEELAEIAKKVKEGLQKPLEE
jgi:glutathionylspermidine synthase